MLVVSSQINMKRPAPKIEHISFTREGYKKIEQELAEIQASRKEAVETLSAARALGDLSENGLYTAAKSRLRHIDTEINRRKYYLKVGVIHDVGTSVVGVGSSVEVQTNKGTRTFQIVGDTESDPLAGKITKKSPIGSALMGKKKGDIVKISTPSGTIEYTISKITA
jgi:transcription elongation factor GreA